MNAQALLESVVLGYMECALWSSTDAEGEPLDGFYELYDFSDEANASIHETCQDFLDLVEDERIAWETGWSSEQLGHDLWLTRNRHGAGFWDRYGAPNLCADMGDRLTKLAHPYGESTLYVGDDGKLHVT